VGVAGVALRRRLPEWRPSRFGPSLFCVKYARFTRPYTFIQGIKSYKNKRKTNLYPPGRSTMRGYAAESEGPERDRIDGLRSLVDFSRCQPGEISIIIAQVSWGATSGKYPFWKRRKSGRSFTERSIFECLRGFLLKICNQNISYNLDPELP
jgi:hypothetical protein